MQKLVVAAIRTIPAGHPPSPASSTNEFPGTGASPSTQLQPEARDQEEGQPGSKPSRKRSWARAGVEKVAGPTAEPAASRKSTVKRRMAISLSRPRNGSAESPPARVSCQRPPEVGAWLRTPSTSASRPAPPARAEVVTDCDYRARPLRCLSAPPSPAPVTPARRGQLPFSSHTPQSPHPSRGNGNCPLPCHAAGDFH